MMLFHSSIRRELARTFGATLLVLVTIVITMLLIRTLGLANRGRVDPEEIMLVLTYTVLGRMPTVLTLALFVAIVFTLSRMFRDSEMVVWFSSGRGLAGFLSPVMRFAWPILAVITLMVLFVWPWANGQTDDLRERYERRGDLERIAPGQFQESSSGRRVFFIDKDTADGQEGRNVFISNIERDGTESITSAQSGRVEWVDNIQYLMLDNGQRLEQPSPDGTRGSRISEFDTYGIQIAAADPASAIGRGLKAVPTWTLLQNPERAYLGELGWRIGMAWTAVNFVLLAVAASAGNPRAGRSWNLAFTLFAFVFYNNLLNLGQGWVATGLVGLVPFMLGLHGSVMALCLLWLAKRHYNWGLWPRRAPRVPAATGQPA